jgi:hypothetical protein
MATQPLLIIRTARHRYAIRRDDLFDARLVPELAVLKAGGLFDQACLGVELGPLLDPADQSAQHRRHALIVTMRRRYVALLVDQVEQFLEAATATPLPTLLRARLQHSWAIGALTFEDDLIIQLDLRAIARSALLGSQNNTERKGNTIYVTDS